MTTKTKTVKYNMAVRLPLAGLAGCVLSVILIAAFAFALQKQWLPSSGMTYINLGVKLAAALVSALIAALSAESRAPLWGALASGVYMAATYLLFSLFSGGFSIGWGNLTDLLMCLIVGLITGIAVNAVKK